MYKHYIANTKLTIFRCCAYIGSTVYQFNVISFIYRITGCYCKM